MAGDLKSRYGQWALITGAARELGLGAAFARHLAAQGINLVLIDIRAEELQARAEELRGRFGVEVLPLVIDLGREDFLPELDAALAGREIDILICNHYYLAAIERFFDISLDEQLRMLHVNARGYLMLTHHLGKPMSVRKRGAIVLVSSLSALLPVPFSVLYGANKAFELNMGEAIRGELHGTGVDVISLIGPFMNTTDMRDAGYPKFLIEEPEKVVRAVFRALGKRARILPSAAGQILVFMLTRLFPRQWGVYQFGQLVWRGRPDSMKQG